MSYSQAMYTLTNFFQTASTERTITLAVAAVLAVIAFIGWCGIFRKADQPIWKLFIPLYGTYSSYGIADCEVIFCFTLLISFIFMPLLNSDMPIAILAIYLILLVVLNIVFCTFLAGSFGKNWLFVIGLFLLHPFFVLILGFDKSKYTFGASMEATSKKKPKLLS